ncbi:MAG TPA: hypothetical protein DEG17_06165 [Cyanobacteria bacterium UBA11149]|nr:hypothetical protein [Cyanobacteria bacterium UBA11367]HBE59152.1 hypothetical protein [Cyanobacteria bacterium UBA11366]HBR75697.1 hypothetical protein [Cyanobacteria bacterium UBA11159]HBS69675.1 hypothetical protein [Cyanobacteria bacterium UBA11153]HBW88462.1 hypothetical protein [Cyanobacteria bacterium UBA11149]HCA93782.1 hypothetical protein [Cyanobacteria bacterium UBA9226]
MISYWLLIVGDRLLVIGLRKGQGRRDNEQPKAKNQQLTTLEAKIISLSSIFIETINSCKSFS